MAAEVRDIIITPPANGKYASLKNGIQSFLTADELDDRKLTKLLCRMCQLIGINRNLLSNDLLKQLFVQRLPHNVQVVLAFNNTLNLDQFYVFDQDWLKLFLSRSRATLTPWSSLLSPHFLHVDPLVWYSDEIV